MSLNLSIFGLCIFLLGAGVVLGTADLRRPGNNRGYAPEQPIAFSHRLHAGEMKMDCQYCHFGARNSRHAGVPPASLCMNCHKVVSSSLDAMREEKAAAEAEEREPRNIVSDEMAKLYAALGLDENREPIPGAVQEPIEWVRVHNMADFVYFDHRPHVARPVACETCHGPVQSMERMRQQESLSMGWCIQCHRDNDARVHVLTGTEEGAVRSKLGPEHVSTDCSTCHL